MVLLLSILRKLSIIYILETILLLALIDENLTSMTRL
jgi:hypothetical protein